jgi:hypothetical protein
LDLAGSERVVGLGEPRTFRDSWLSCCRDWVFVAPWFAQSEVGPRITSHSANRNSPMKVYEATSVQGLWDSTTPKLSIA